MIPFVLPAAIPWRLIGIVAAAGAALLLFWRVNVWHEAYGELKATQARLAAEESCERGSKCAARVAAVQARQAAVSQQVMQSYEKEIADIRNRPAERRVIRVCPDPGDVRHAKSAQGTDAAGTRAGLVHGEVEFNTRPLRDLAREADEVAARLRALQGFNEALSKPAD